MKITSKTSYAARRALVLLTFLLAGVSANGAEIRVAVASNFVVPAKLLAREFEASSRHDVVLLSGSTGKHAAQIKHGLQVDVFLAADSARPRWLEKQGLAVAGSRFTYAIGRLALWQPSTNSVGKEALLTGQGRLAIANPKLAPYGAAAIQVLKALEVYQHWQAKLVRGENIAQAYQFVHTGNADLGLVAASQLNQSSQDSWLVPAELHSPIEQQAVLLSDCEAARIFYAFLQSEKALELIRQHGYDTP